MPLFRTHVSRLILCLLAIVILLVDHGTGRSAHGEKQNTTLELKTLALDARQSVDGPQFELHTFTLETVPTGVVVNTGFGLAHAGTIRTQLRDGAVMNLQCLLTLEHVRSLLSNTVLSEASRSYQLRHDLLAREFILTSPNAPVIRQKQFDALLESAWGHLKFQLPLAEPLLTGETYRVQFKVTLEHAEVPPWLEKALFFWSWEVAPPLSFSQDFVF